ncbi:MAG: rhtC 1 [Frankiales bacterium]|nr:rhtC 1 [Frankiales bacterium]
MILAWCVVALLLTLTPGADTALVLRTTVRSGPRAAVRCTLGICTGTMTWATLSAVGVAALVAASPVAFDVLRYAGAGYLLWLGLHALRARPAAVVTDVPGRAFRDGLVTNLLNPKIGVFYATLLPQFIRPGQSVLGRSLLLAGIHALMGLLWLSLVALAASRMAAVLRRETWRRRMERVTGVVLLGFGVKLLAG